MGKMKEMTESQLERMVRAGKVQVEDRSSCFAVLMDCTSYKMFTVRIAGWAR